MGGLVISMQLTVSRAVLFRFFQLIIPSKEDSNVQNAARSKYFFVIVEDLEPIRRALARHFVDHLCYKFSNCQPF